MKPHCNHDTNRLLEAFMLPPTRAIRGYGKKAQALVDQLERQKSSSNELATLRKMARSIEELSVEELIQIVRLITARFHLLNKVEQLQIIRINRERAKDATKESPRNESVRSAILKIEQRGRSKAEIQKSLGKLRIEPTLTAHPTEARRRTILDKQLEVASTLVKLRQKDLTPDEAEGLQRHLVNRIELLLATDDVRVRRLEVPEEVQNGLYFLTTTIWRTVPELAQDLAQSLGVDAAEIPSILQYRSWIGGDRDGNPNVTHQITKSTIEALHAAARELWDAQLKELHRELSPSTRRTNLLKLQTTRSRKGSTPARTTSAPNCKLPVTAFKNTSFQPQNSRLNCSPYAMTSSKLDCLGLPTPAP